MERVPNRAETHGRLRVIGGVCFGVYDEYFTHLVLEINIKMNNLKI